MAIPEWVGRLRDGSFTSPNSITSDFKIDVLTRIGGKKVSNHEILNADKSIPQDQGNRARRYPCEVYFTGDDCDTEADTFFESLHEQYTVASPGILYHPTWGDISVMPFSDPQQTHNLVNGAGIVRVSIEFITVPQSDSPTTDTADTAEISADIDTLEEDLEAANESFDIDGTSAFAAFESAIKTVVTTVSDALSTVAALSDDIEDTFNEIQDDIDSILEIGVDAVEIMSQVNSLIRLPATIIDDTIDKVSSYADMAESIADSFLDYISSTADRTIQINNALLFQDLYSITTASMVEAALYTDYSTRDQAADVLDNINDSELTYADGVAETSQTLSGGVSETYVPDHNTGLSLTLLVGKTNVRLVNESFSLKRRKNITLDHASDAMTLTWKYYQSTDTEDLEFFINTNNLQDSEILEIPSGRSLVVYV